MSNRLAGQRPGTLELVRDGENVSLNMPLVSLEQYGIIRGLLEPYAVAEDAPIFSDVTPEGSSTFTALDCTAIRTAAEAAGRFFDETNLGREIWNALSRNGDLVKLDAQIIPVEQSAYRR